MYRTILAALGAFLLGGFANAADATAQELPNFLNPYYAPIFTLDGQMLQLAGHEEKNNITHFAYSTQDRATILTVEYFPCQSDLCRTVLTNAVKYANEQANASGGQFRLVNDSEYRAEWSGGMGYVNSFVFRLPSSVQFWTYAAQKPLQLDAAYTQLIGFVNRQRYEDAMSAGNVEMGRWDVHLRDFARQLLKGGDLTDAIIVLRNIIGTTPFDFEAQMDFAANAPEKDAAQNSARAVLDNAESPELLARAAQYLNAKRPDIDAMPLVNKDDRGLRVVLVPLGNADIGLLGEAAKIYETITNIPTKIERLSSAFRFENPDRPMDQRAIQQTIVQKQGPTVDFTGWDTERYGSELMRTVANADPLARYSMRSYVQNLATRPGQYRVDPYLDRFGDGLISLRSKDPKTIYVGVTDANIYSGDVNYLFSQSTVREGSYVSILSYAMMTAKTLGEPYESRKRLAQRLAKELVPASLKALNIPRPADPTDPYSYSNGVERLNEKTLVLSKPTKDALDKFH
jgi:hypothetical protein